MGSEISKSWFAVLNNPADHGYTGTPAEVCNRLREEWTANSSSRAGAWAYCISAEGLHHIHMVLEDKVSMRFSKIKKSYAVGMHFEATRGNKDQAEDYINKRGQFAEKGERVLYLCRAGEIKAAQGKRSDIEEIAAMLRVPAATVRTRLRRARMRLKDLLGGTNDEQEQVSECSGEHLRAHRA